MQHCSSLCRHCARLADVKHHRALVAFSATRATAWITRSVSPTHVAAVRKICRSFSLGVIKRPLRPRLSTITPCGRLSTSSVTGPLWSLRVILSRAVIVVPGAIVICGRPDELDGCGGARPGGLCFGEELDRDLRLVAKRKLAQRADFLGYLCPSIVAVAVSLVCDAFSSVGLAASAAAKTAPVAVRWPASITIGVVTLKPGGSDRRYRRGCRRQSRRSFAARA